MGKRRWIVFFLLAALAMGLMIPCALADEVVYFTAINNTLLDLTADTMPVVHNSLIYLPSSVFNTRALSTWAYYSRGGQSVMISDGTKELYFDMSAGNSHDREENTYQYAAIYANDTAYVPAFFEADYFGLGYSYIRREGWHIVRITSEDALSDNDFFNAAAPLLEARMNQYLSTQETAAPLPSVTPSVTPSVQPSPPATPTPIIDRSGVMVHLCYLGLGEQSAEILDALDGEPACFFATAEEIYAWPDLTRRMIGSGCTVGLRIREDGEREYEEFRKALRDTAMCTSFLVQAVMDTEAALAWAGGPPILLTEEPLDSAWACVSRLEAAEERCDLALSGSFEDTASLLYLLKQEHYTLEAVTEVTAGR